MAQYRSYESPQMLEEQLQKELERFKDPNVVMEYEDFERIEELRERINFAWQDEEYNQMCAEYDSITGGLF